MFVLYWVKLQMIFDGTIKKLESHTSPSMGELFVLDHIELPFQPKRIFFVSNVPKNTKRGEHAHKTCSQLIIVTRGVVEILFDTGTTSKSLTLEESADSILIPPLIWSTQRTLSNFSNICVLASHPYDPKDYIHDYSIFKSLLKNR